MAKASGKQPSKDTQTPLAAAVTAITAAQPQALPTRCSGVEINVGIVPLHQGDAVNLRVVLCESAFRVRVHLDDNVIFDQEDLKNQVDIPLPPLSAGFHSLTWGFLASGDPWHTRSEVQVGGLVRFALNKGNSSSMPSNNVAVVLQVI